MSFSNGYGSLYVRSFTVYFGHFLVVYFIEVLLSFRCFKSYNKFVLSVAESTKGRQRLCLPGSRQGLRRRHRQLLLVSVAW